MKFFLFSTAVLALVAFAIIGCLPTASAISTPRPAVVSASVLDAPAPATSPLPQAGPTVAATSAPTVTASAVDCARQVLDLKSTGSSPTLLTVQVPADETRPVYRISYDPAAQFQDYQAVACSVMPLDSPLAAERGVDKGLIVFPQDSMRRERSFSIPAAQMLARIHGEPLTPEQTFVDVLITRDNITVVESTTANAGMFGMSSVYTLGKGAAGDTVMVALGAAGPHLSPVVNAALELYNKDKTSGHAPTQARDVPGWKTFKADSGFQVSYPLDTYSMRDAPTSTPVVFPGVKVLEPNDSFYYREPRRLTYKIYFFVIANENKLSLADSKTLLSQNAMYPYDPSALDGKSIERFKLDGVDAIRVQSVSASGKELTLQISAIRKDFVYTILVVPHELTGNQAEPFQKGAYFEANHRLAEQIWQTFRFTD